MHDAPFAGLACGPTAPSDEGMVSIMISLFIHLAIIVLAAVAAFGIVKIWADHGTLSDPFTAAFLILPALWIWLSALGIFAYHWWR